MHNNRVGGGGGSGYSHHQWWPEQQNLLAPLFRNQLLVKQKAEQEALYRRRFAQLDLTAVEQDLHQLMTSSQDFWPADYGHYGPFFIRYVFFCYIHFFGFCAILFHTMIYRYIVLFSFTLCAFFYYI
jgi:catalase (peroxidase I)